MTEASSDDRRPGWGIPDAALALVGASLLSALTGGLWAAATGTTTPTFGLTMASLVGLWAGFVGIPLVVARVKGSGSLAEDYGARVRPGDVGPGIVAGLASQLVLVPLVYVPLRALFPDTFADPGRSARELIDQASGPAIALMVVALVVGAPIVEELVFRGLLQRALVRRLGPPVGVGVGAVVFAFTHYNVVAFPGLVAFGVVVGVLAHQSGRLGPSIFAHVAFNAVTVALQVATR